MKDYKKNLHENIHTLIENSNLSDYDKKVLRQEFY